MYLLSKINVKKIVAVLLAIFMILPMMPSLNISAAGSNTVTIFSEDENLAFKLTHNGIKIGTTDAWYTENGKNYPAYCLNPNRPGAGEVGSYSVTVSETGITDPKIVGIILAGYPYKNFDVLGVGNAWEGAFVTKFALKIYLESQLGIRNVAGWEPINPDNQYIYDAIMRIYNEGIKNTTIPPLPTVTVTATGGNNMTIKDIGGITYYTKEYTVTSNVQIKSYTVALPSGVPSGTKIVSSNGTTEKTTFAPGEKFMLRIPEDSVTKSGSITLDIKGEVANQTILYGDSGNNSTQDYALTGAAFTFKNANAYATYTLEPTTETTTEPTTEPTTQTTTEPTTEPTTSEPGPGDMAIIKLESGTNKPVAGAVFEIKNSAGSIVFSGATDGSGKITLSVPIGYYSVTEIVPPAGYALDPNPHKDNILIREGETTTVTFTNKKLSTLEITKKDADTGKLLENATIRIAKDGGTNSWDVVTNALGVAVLKDIPDGTYTVTEIIAPENYILDSTPHIIVLEAGKTATITLKNNAKPGILIKKYDENTGLPLGKAEFSVAKMGGQIVYEGITDDSGVIKIDNLDEGWYKITEIAAPPGYLKATESKDVYLPANKCVEVKFDNRLRPALRIIKRDGKTSEPLRNVKFRVQATEDSTVSEYLTDENGIITIKDLDEKIYSVWEVEAPKGYLFDSEHRDIKAEWGIEKTLVFINNKRPELEIVKINSAGEPLAGAVFTVKRAGSTTEYELITDKNGRILIPFDSPLYPLEADRYIVTEKVPPNGYILAEPNYREIVLEPNTRKTLTFENPEKPKLTIAKYDQRGDGKGGLLPLSAVTFRIWKSDGSYDKNLTTGTDGKIRITDLMPGEYQIKEIAAKDGYVLNPETKTVILHGNDDVTVTVHNLKRPEIVILKLDGKTNKPLKNAHFRISKGDQVLFDDLITDENGEIIIPYNDKYRLLEEGVYKITETAPPPGYDIVLPASKNVILKNGERTRVEFFDIRKPTFILTKLNALTKKPIPNTLYNIKWENPANGGVHDLGNWYTDKNGQIIFEFVEVGWYVITELMPAPGMTKAKNPVTRIYLAPGANAYSDSELRTNDNSSGQNQNTSGPGENTINNNNNPAKGNGITVIDPFNNTQVINLPSHEYNPATGGSNGITVIDPAAGLSGKAFELVSEIETIPEVKISGVAVNDSEPEINVVFLYDEIDMTETVLSSDEIKNREYDGDDLYINPNYATMQTGGVGDAFIDYSGNNYTLTSNGFMPASNNSGTIIDFPLNSIIIKKEDATNGSMLAGAVFELYRMSDETSGQSGTLVARLVTGNSGMLAVIGLEAGTYLVKEVRAPENYTLNNQGVQTALFVPDNTSNIEFTFSNYPFGAILVDKTCAVTNKPLSGARFELKRADGSHVAYGNTDNYGHIVFGFLEPGAYVVAEQEAPNGYRIDTSPQTVYVPANGRMQTVYFKNQPFGSLVVIKKDAKLFTPIRGVKYRITDIHGANIGDITPGNGFTADGIYTTDGNGEIRIDHIPQGYYQITEVYAPDGYIIDESTKVVYVEWGKIKTVEAWNSRKGALVVVKYDSVTKKPLKDAVFMVTDSKGAVVGNSGGLFRTDETGHIYIYDLTPGSYRVYEKSAPAGYILDNTVKTVDIVDEKMYYLEFFNEPVNNFTIIKYDSITREPLKNAVIRVQKLGSTTTFIGDFETNADGKIVIENLLPGAYSVQEIKAPPNYVLDNTVINISLEQNKPQVVTLYNAPYGNIIIRKVEAETLIPLENAEFSVVKADGTFIGNYRSGADGTVRINAVAPGFYTVTETKAPENYTLGDNIKTIEVKAAETAQVEFQNRAFGSLVIKKIDKISLKPLASAQFSVYHQGGAFVGEYETGADGTINIPALEPGYYVITETRAPFGYVLDSTGKTVEVKAVVPTVVTFTNAALSGIEIVKKDYFTMTALKNAIFVVERSNGEKIGEFTTDNTGKIIISGLTDGTYIISEIFAPAGYIISESPKTVTVSSGKLTSVTFLNKPLSGIEILKTDEFSSASLPGAKFMIERANGEKIGEYVTDRTGKILVTDLAEGVYIVSEVTAPYGYVKSESPKTVIVKSGKLTTIEVTNRPFSGIEIVKKDYFKKNALIGATFLVERANGEKIGEFTTDETGKIIVSGLTDGVYIISEIIAPDGYVISESPKTVIVTSGKLTSVTFLNKPLSGIEILKLDKFTMLGLSGATFEINRANGEKIATVKTDRTGKAIVYDLEDGVYIISETIAPSDYEIDEVPKTIEVKSGKLTEVQFFNKPLATLKILKLSSTTREVIPNVEFTISKMNGEKLLNEFGSLTFKTDISGAIYIPNLTEGYYVVTEIKTVEGYFLNKEPKTVLVESGRTTVLEVLNVPMAGLLLVKTDEMTGRPVQGAVYDIKRVDGSFVTGNIMDGNQPGTPNNSPSKSTSENGDITGSYTTDANGRIQINGLAAGEYMIVERKAPDGYELDKTVYSVTVIPGKMATIQLTNKPKSGLRLVKIDSITKKGIYNVEFMLFDRNHKVVGVYYTDNNGIIDFPTDLSEGRYTIRETRAAKGYYLDDMPRTVEFVAGRVTEIVWENTPELGQIQILKKSADDNEINGLPAGTPLQGAIFEVYNYRTGALIDRFVSGKDGRAISNPLPLGRYIVKEVQAPKYYILSEKTLDIELEFATQIIRKDFLNYSVNTGVSIRKTGNLEAMPNDVIRFDIKELRNTSTVPLTDFYWRDILPTNAVRLTKIVTGTYNQSLKYKVIVTTNKGDTRVIADNLSTTKNNVIDCSNAALGLKSDEFVTSFSLIFGKVKAGFSLVETPQIFVKVLPNLQNGYEFANKCDVGGKYGNEWIIGNSVWTVKTFSPPKKLPQTGY